MDSLVERLKDRHSQYGPDVLEMQAATAITTLQSELLEQARIIGKSAEREERLAARVRELEKLAGLVAKILPSAAGLDDAPPSKIIACYLSMGELRAIRHAIADMEQADADQ